MNMSEIPKRYCVFGCDFLVTYGVPIHRFPNPDKKPDLFYAWISVVGDKLKETDHMKIYKSKRLCDHHFDPSDKMSANRLKPSAVPSVNLHRIQQGCKTFLQADHCYSRSLRESLQAVPLMDITNLPGPSRPAAVDPTETPLPSESTETACVTATDSSQFRTSLTNTRPLQEILQAVPLMDITNLPGPSRPAEIDSTEIPLPSGSTETTCLTVTDMSQFRKSRTKFDAEKTFEFLREKSANECARKVRQKHNEIRRLRQKVIGYKMRLRQLRRASLKTDFEKLTRNMPKSAKLFTRMQFMEGVKKKKGHRFTVEEKILSLSLYKKSPKAYALMCKHFTLPSRKVLKSLLAQIKIQPGINPVIFNQLKLTVSKLQPQDRLCTVIFDEMSILPQIFYNQHTDDLVGFENLGEEKSQHFANHALVFMVKGIVRNFKQPVAYYFTQCLSTPKLKKILKTVVSEVQATGLKVVATVCDQGSPNSSCINDLISEAKSNYFNLGKEWRDDVIIINNQEIVPLFDVPHLIKGIRNNLLNKDLTYKIINEEKNVKWEYFQKIYAADKAHGELRLLPKLTREHVDPTKIKKMRVKHAVQILSHSVAVATDNLVARGDLPQECCNVIPFLILIDKLFDSLNASSFSVPRGKKYRAAVKRNSPHHQLWQEALQLLKSIKFICRNRDGSTTVKHVPTVNNFIKTIEGFKRLWQLLSKRYSIDSMLTRNFNQDPLENFFGSIRSLGARNVAPNCMGFEGAFKTLLLNNMSSDHSINSNCEKDSNTCLQSLTFFIKNKDNASSQPQDNVIDQHLDVMPTSVADSGDDQRTYVCGWALTKCLQKVIKGCKQCKSKLLGDPKNAKYRFIAAKEYENKEWLTYPSDTLVACFQKIQNTTIAFLNNECYKKKIKERIIASIDTSVDFSFLNCIIHKDNFKDCFLNTTINIIIYSWCRTINRILEGKILYEGDDNVQKAAQLYYNKHKTLRK